MVANRSVSRWESVTIRGSGLGPALWDVLTSVTDWDPQRAWRWHQAEQSVPHASGLGCHPQGPGRAQKDLDEPKNGSS